MGSIINVQILEANYTSSSVHENLKLLGETGSGDNSIYLGAYKTDKEKTMFESFLGTQIGSPVEVTVFKQDLLDYLENAKPEFEDPKQTYREDISRFYDKLKSYVQSINTDSIVIKFKTSIRKKKDSAQIWIFKNPNDPYFDYLYSICLPRLSQLRFYKDLSSNQLFLKPLFDDRLKIKEKPIAYFPLVKHSEHYPLQQIFYGAPGTGKSFKTNEVAQKYSTIRTTFHPDSDYSTFVGVYKPTTFKQDRYGLYGSDTVALKYPDGINKDHPIPESKIEYRFVKQAFLKAYIKAWKFLAQYNITSSISPSKVVCENGQDRWILNSMDDNKVYYTKISTLPLESYGKIVKACWERIVALENPDDFSPGTTERYQATPCIWFRDNYSLDYSADDCWKTILEELNKGEISAQPGSNQKYTVELKDGSIIITSEYKAWKTTIKGYFDGSKKKDSASIQKLIADELKKELVKEEVKQSEDIFGAAWKKLKERVGLIDSAISSASHGLTPQFLVIEEINRGNCAQVFGDLFQLLDRKMGYSEYPIDADEDIRNSLLSEDTDEDPSFGEEGLQFTEDQKNAINAIYQKEGVPFRDVANDIAKGKILVLPPNLYIWATMNTSDQSLFPMDSAFKRRWAWEYVPIDYANEESGIFTITIGKKVYPWHDFLRIINDKIKKVTSSEDKQMGNFFIKQSIDEKEFKDKVMFYLWSEVGKDNYQTNDALFHCYKPGTKDKIEFSFNELYASDNIQKLQDFMDILGEEAKSKNYSWIVKEKEAASSNDDKPITGAEEELGK